MHQSPAQRTEPFYRLSKKHKQFSNPTFSRPLDRRPVAKVHMGGDVLPVHVVGAGERGEEGQPEEGGGRGAAGNSDRRVGDE